MKYYSRFNNVPLVQEGQAPHWDASFDIVIAGAGSGGIYASLSAAREGKTVLLLEKTHWCGGQHVQGLVNGYYYGFREGLFRQTDRRTKEETGSVFYDPTDGKRLVIAEELKEAGVRAETSSVATGIYAEDQRILGVQVLIAHELKNVQCKMLIDATSEGYLLRLLPIPLSRGRDWDGQVQPFSSVRSVYLDSLKYDGGLSVTVGDMGKRYSLFHEYRDSGYMNQYDQREYTHAILRANAGHLASLGEASRFLFLAPNIGLREGNTYEGEQKMTLREVLYERNWPENVLVYCFSDVDKHGHDIAFDEDIYQNWFVNCNMSTCTVYVPLPVGALVPKGWKGLATAGRCLSTDTYANATVRMNTDCFRVGEACGTLCAMAIDHDQSPMDVPYEELKAKLIGYGFMEEQPDLRPSFWTPALGNDRKYVSWMREPEEIQKALSTDCPAVALWSCHLMGKEQLGDAVFEMTKSKDDMLRMNAGIALGVMHDERAKPLLREIIRDRKPFFFMDCRRSNQMRSVIALCLEGQMADAEITDELLNIIRPEEFDQPIYHELTEPEYKRSVVKEMNLVYFHHFTHAVAALVKIALAHPERKREITEALHAALDDGQYLSRMVHAPEHNAFYRAAANCQKYVQAKLG